MLTIFYRRFYILLFLVWLAAAAGLFILSVWGNLDTFIDNFSSIVKVDVDNSTNGTLEVENGTAAVMQVVEQVGHTIRREVVHDVRKVEAEVEDVFAGNASASAPDPVAMEIKEDLSANRTEAVTAGDSGRGDLSGIDFTHTPEQFLARLTTSRKVGRVTYFHLDKPAKLVVDLRGKWSFSTRRVTDFADGFVGQVVLGRHPDRLRLVFVFSDFNATVDRAPQLIRTPEGLDIVVDRPKE